MVEAVGDSTRDGRWALVRLAVEGERIVSAEAEGLERPLDGPDAARGGGRRRRRARRGRARKRARAGLSRRAATRPRRRGDERRRRQRGRAAARRRERDRRHLAPLARPAGARRRARLLLARGRDRRARGPATGSGSRTSRSTCARSFAARWSSRSCAATRPARRRTRASAATAASASPSCSPSPSAPAPSGSRRATTRASSSATGGCCSRARPTSGRISRTCSAGSTRASSTGSGSRSASRARTRREPRPRAPGSRPRAAPRARRRASSPAATTETSSAGTGSRREEGPVVDEQGNELGRHAGFWRFTPGQRKGLGVAAGEPLYALRSEPRTNAVVVGPRAALATTEVSVRGRLHVELDRVEAKLRYRSPAVGASVTQDGGRFPSRPRPAGVRRRAGPGRRALRRGRRRRRGNDPGRSCRNRCGGSGV